MQFVNPRTDYAFKKIFGSAESKDILIAFLNAIVYENQNVIADLEIIDPYLAPQSLGFKDSYLDVQAKLQDGTFVIVEMQVLHLPSFGKRILYNTAKAYVNQLVKGFEYDRLVPVIALTIVNFVLFAEIDRVISHFTFYERHTQHPYVENDLLMVFVELPKFEKTEEELVTLSDRWLYFLRKAETLSAIPASLQSVPELDRALQIANRVNIPSDEWDELEKQGMYVRGQQLAFEVAEERGKKAQSVAIARQLLPLLDDAAIAETTGLTEAEVRSLRKS